MTVRVVLICAALYRALALGGLDASVGRAALDARRSRCCIAVALALADRVLMGYKWRQLVRAAGGSLRLRDATNIYYQTCFTDLVFPNVVASEGLRVYLGRRLGIPLALLLGSMAIERMIAAAVAIVLAGQVSCISRPKSSRRCDRPFSRSSRRRRSLASLGVLAVWWTPLHRIAGRALREKISPKLFQLFKKISDALVAYRGQPRRSRSISGSRSPRICCRS